MEDTLRTVCNTKFYCKFSYVASKLDAQFKAVFFALSSTEEPIHGSNLRYFSKESMPLASLPHPHALCLVTG